MVWSDSANTGVKIGPLSVIRYRWDGPKWHVSFFSRWFLDTGL